VDYLHYLELAQNVVYLSDRNKIQFKDERWTKNALMFTAHENIAFPIDIAAEKNQCSNNLDSQVFLVDCVFTRIYKRIWHKGFSWRGKI
jgi:hypothetical protein